MDDSTISTDRSANTTNGDSWTVTTADFNATAQINGSDWSVDATSTFDMDVHAHTNWETKNSRDNYTDFTNFDTTGIKVAGNEITFSQSKSGKIIKLFAKFKDYFSYAIVLGEEVPDDQMMNGCDQDCGSGMWSNMCCAQVSMSGPG